MMDSVYVPKTKKEAKELGLRTNGIFRRGAIPVVVKGQSFYRPEDVEPTYSITAAKKLGMKLKERAEPACQKYAQRIGHWDEYRESDFDKYKKRTKTTIPAVVLSDSEIVSCIKAVNEAAKRHRDAAAGFYSRGQHGLASNAKWKKIELYDLKDRGIAWLADQSLIKFYGLHGNLALWKTECGSVFHSTICPKEIEVDKNIEDPYIFQEATRSKGLPRMKDAILTLNSLEDKQPLFQILESPSVDSLAL